MPVGVFSSAWRATYAAKMRQAQTKTPASRRAPSLPNHGHAAVEEIDVLLFSEVPLVVRSQVVDGDVNHLTEVINEHARDPELALDDAVSVAVHVRDSVGGQLVDARDAGAHVEVEVA